MELSTKTAFSISVLGCVFITSISAYALPSYRRLYERKYGYKTSCFLCHSQGGGSAPTKYGKDFKRRGMTLSAFVAIEALDSDKDGINNKAEILARSNPGDSKSTPSNPGEWLKDAEGIPIPTKELAQFFGSEFKFSAIEGSLKPEQVSKVETEGSLKLNEEDKVPTFYFAAKDGKKVAVAQYVSTESGQKFTVIIAMSVKGEITKVQVLGADSIKNKVTGAFLKQFNGKSKSEQIVYGSTVKELESDKGISKGIVSAVKKALLTIKVVFSKT